MRKQKKSFYGEKEYRQVGLYECIEFVKRLERPLFDYDDERKPTPAEPIVKHEPKPLTEADLPEVKPIWTRGKQK